MCRIIQIAARDPNNVIGVNGKLPWNCPEDLRQFRRKTIGNIVVMGTTTYDSVAHQLKDRIVYRLTRVIKDINDINIDGILSLKKLFPEKTIYIAGGESTYTNTLHITDKVDLTTMVEEAIYSHHDEVRYYPFNAMCKLFKHETKFTYFNSNSTFNHELFTNNLYLRRS